MRKVIITKAQILHLLSVFVVVPVSGWVTAWVGKHFPGMPHFSKADVEGFFITGSGAALAAAIHYLHGWQVWERTVGKFVDVENKAPAPHSPNITGV